MTDERKGIPSASSMGRIVACPASFSREKDRPEEHSDVGVSGTVVHQAIATGDIAGLSDHEQYMVHACLAIEQSICDSLGFSKGTFGMEVDMERRLWLDPKGVNDVNVSGRFDKVYRLPGRTLIVDYKSGRRETTAAAENWQMATYAVLLWVEADEHGETLVDIAVAVVQPLGVPDRTIARYTLKEIKEAGRQIVAALRAAKDVKAVAIPGEHCYYCKARGDCPEAMEFAKQTVRADEVSIEKVGRKEEIRLPEMTPGQLLNAYQMSGTIKRILEAVGDKFKESVRNGEQPDYEMRPGSATLELRNPVTVFKRLRTIVPLRRLLGTAKLKVDEMDEIVAVSLKVSKTKAREFWVPLVADGLDVKEGAQQVRKKKND